MDSWVGAIDISPFKLVVTARKGIVCFEVIKTEEKLLSLGCCLLPSGPDDTSSLGNFSSPFHCGGLGSILRYTIFNLWWTEWHWTGFCWIICVLLYQCFVLICVPDWYNTHISVLRTDWVVFTPLVQLKEGTSNKGQLIPCQIYKELIIALSIYLWLYSPCGTWLAFQFLILYKVGRTPWTWHQPTIRPLPIHKQHKHTHTDIHVSSGIRSHDPSGRADEENLCLKASDHCDRLLYPCTWFSSVYCNLKQWKQKYVQKGYCYLHGWYAVCSGRNWPTLRRNILPLSSSSNG
jgi:hypothetical protein